MGKRRNFRKEATERIGFLKDRVKERALAIRGSSDTYGDPEDRLSVSYDIWNECFYYYVKGQQVKLPAFIKACADSDREYMAANPEG